MWGHDRCFAPGSVERVAFVLCAAQTSAGCCFSLSAGDRHGLISCAPTLVTSLYPEARRSHALGVFTLMYALGSAAGPLLGGVLVAHLGGQGVLVPRADRVDQPPFAAQLAAGSSAATGERFDVAGALLLAGLRRLLLAINAVPRLKDDYLALFLFPAAARASSPLCGGKAAQPSRSSGLNCSARPPSRSSTSPAPRCTW